MRLITNTMRWLKRVRHVPRGVDLLYDVKRVLRRRRLDVAFDVGANIGQTVDYLHAEFPDATVHCFEPAASHHATLLRRHGRDRRVKCNRFGLGPSEQEAELSHTTDASMHFINCGYEATDSSPVTETGKERVSIRTLDGYCSQHGIDRIDFLKIDTEGYDIEVLKGARSMLAQGAIGVVECEASMDPDNRFHQPMETIKSHMEVHGYRLFGIYEQKSRRTPNLRRANIAFVSPEIMRDVGLENQGRG